MNNDMEILMLFNTINPLRLPPAGQFYSYQTLHELEMVKNELNNKINTPEYFNSIKNLYNNWKPILNDNVLNKMESYLLYNEDEYQKNKMLEYIRNSPILRKLDEEELDDITNSLGESLLSDDEIKILQKKLKKVQIIQHNKPSINKSIKKQKK